MPLLPVTPPQISGSAPVDSKRLNELRHRAVAMKHVTILWNPATQEWFCTKCGRTSDHIRVQDAHAELDQYDCEVPAVEMPKPRSGE